MNLEALLTHAEGFGLTEATPVQRAVCRIMKGEPLAELATNPDVIKMVGGPAALAALPKKAPRLVCLGAAVRCAKSTIVGADALSSAYNGDCSGLGPGEIPRVNIVSVDLDKAKETFSKITGAVLASARLSSLLVRLPNGAQNPGIDSILIRNRSGRPVEIKMIAGARAGQTLISRWCLGAIFDEAPRMLGQADGIVNLEDALSAIRARMRPGAQIYLVGSLWAPRGPVFELVTKRFGQPGEDLVVMVATGPMLRPDLYTPEYCEQIRKDDDRAYESDVMSRFADPETALVPSVEITAATRSDKSIGPTLGQSYVAIMDPATRGNGWTLVVLGTTVHGKYELTLAREWIGSRSQPLKASNVLPEVDALLKPYGVSAVYTDQHGYDFLADIAELSGVSFSLFQVDRDDEIAGKRFIRLLTERLLTLPDVAQLRQDLIALKRKPKQGGGSQIILPKTADGRHCDYGAAVLLGMMVMPDATPVIAPPPLDEEQMFCSRMEALSQQSAMDAAASRLMGAA